MTTSKWFLVNIPPLLSIVTIFKFWIKFWSLFSKLYTQITGLRFYSILCVISLFIFETKYNVIQRIHAHKFSYFNSLHHKGRFSQSQITSDWYIEFIYLFFYCKLFSNKPFIQISKVIE